MRIIDNTIWVEAHEVQVGDVLYDGSLVTRATLVADAFVKLETGAVKQYPGKHQLVGLHEVALD